MEEIEIFSTRLTRKKEVLDCPVAKKREKALEKRKVIKIQLINACKLMAKTKISILDRSNFKKM